MKKSLKNVNPQNYRRPTDYECAIMARLVYNNAEDQGEASYETSTIFAGRIASLKNHTIVIVAL